MKPKKISFTRLSPSCYAFTAEGDPNTGVIVGDDGVMVIDAQATPLMAREVLRRIRRVTSKPVKYVVLSHYHAVRVLGASAYRAREIIASERTLGLIRERGRQDMASEIGRFPRLFRGAGSIPGLTWPTITFRDSMTLMLGKLEVRILH
ncbi:MAG: MBL fold metallo-hydrolase, partial [Burkholderiales bacterium]